MSTTTYTIGIRYSSIASARELKVIGSLAAAKRAATREFAGEQNDHRIVIVDERGETVTSRLVGDRAWADATV